MVVGGKRLVVPTEHSYQPFIPPTTNKPPQFPMSTDRLSQLEDLLKEDPTDSFLHYGIALEYAKKGNVEEAIARIEKLLSEKPDYLGAYYQLGHYYEVVKKDREAIHIYEKGILLAKKLGNIKTMNELREALQQLED